MTSKLQLVSDACFWIDVERGGILDDAFRLAQWAAPDLVVAKLRHLEPRVRQMGLHVVTLPGRQMARVVALAGDEKLGDPVVGDILAGNAHTPDLHLLPAVGRCIETRLFSRGYAPQLLGSVDVVVAVVGDAQIDAARPGPVGEHDRQRAPTGGKRRC